jgi:hypothetical protein
MGPRQRGRERSLLHRHQLVDCNTSRHDKRVNEQAGIGERGKCEGRGRASERVSE